MFDFLTKNKRFAQVILALIALPFALFGVDYYFRGGGQEGEVARVGSIRISRLEFDNAIRDQQERMRQALGRNFDPAMFDSPEARRQVLDQLITQRLLLQQGRELRFGVSNEQLEQFIRTLPVFQENGQFSFERYKEAVQAQGMTQPMFEARLRQDLSLRPIEDPFSAGSIAAREYVQHILELAEEQREVQLAMVSPDPFLAQVKIDDAQVKAFYDGNQGSYQLPEQAKVEYLVLSLDALAERTKVDDAEMRALYEQNAKQYAQAEERQASHILINAARDAKAEEKAAAKKKAEELLAQVKAAPGKFEELARQHSQDPGSKDQGGDLGYIGRGTMVKAFEDAVFGLKVGEVAGPIETDFGYHVIRLNKIKGESARPYDEVQPQIEQELKRQKAAKKFAELAEQFQNLVYEQADSLAGVEKALDEKGASAKVQKTDWVTPAQVQEIARGNTRFTTALFAPESVQAKRNTEAIEIAPNTLMAGRVVEHKPAAPRPFDEVKAEILRRLQLRAAAELAQKAGAARLAQLQANTPVNVDFAAPQVITRAQRPDGLTDEAMKLVFTANVAKLPAYVGAPNERGGFTLVKVNRAIKASPDAQRIDATHARVAEQLGREQFNAYAAALRRKGDVWIDQANLARK